VTDDDLQQAYGRVIRSPVDRTACPGPDAIADLAARGGAEETRLAVLDHVMQCAACRRDLDLLLVADRAGARSARAPRWLAAAAAAIVVVGVGGLGAHALLRERPPEVERGGAAGVSPAFPGSGAVVARPVALTWHAVAGVGEYRVELLAADGTPRWSAATRDTSAAVPDSVVARSGDYGWWVTGRLADGPTVSSAVTAFSVR
jgi:hypothetical protein